LQLNLDLQKNKRHVVKETLRAWSEEKKEKTLSSSNNTEKYANCPKEPTRPQTNSSKKNPLVRNRVAKDRFKTEFQKRFKTFQFVAK